MKNCSFAALRFPSPMTRAVSTQAATNVPRLNAAFASGAQRRAPKNARNSAPRSGVANKKRNSTLFLFLERFEVMKIETVELLADLEEKHAQHQHGDQHVERD